MKAGDKLKAILTITNTCNLADQYTISGSAGISFSATKVDILPGKSQKINMAIVAKKSNSKALTLTIVVVGCKGKTKKSTTIKLNYS